MNEFQVSLLAIEATLAAEKAARDWPGVMTPEEVGEGIWGLLTPEYVDLLLGCDPTARSLVFRWLAVRYIRAELTQYTANTSRVLYSVPEVWQWLNQGLLARSQSDLSGERLDTYLDLRRAVRQLAWTHYRTIWLRTLGWEQPGIVRAVQALTEELNGRE